MPSEKRKPAIFINYRRKISQKDANAITAGLQAHFGKEAVFQDTTMDPGEHWKDVIDGSLDGATVLVALIGKGWLECVYEEPNPARGWKKGRCRLDNPNDYVRVEIEEALARNKKIIPVLIDREEYDKEDDFPEGSALTKLLGITPCIIRSGEFQNGLSKLISTIEKAGVNQEAEPSSDAPIVFQLNKEYPLPPRMNPQADAPFVGLRPFTEKQAPLFYGRSQEIYDFCFKVDQDQDCPIILFYGLSGVGKSSLLQAGGIPRLKQKGWLPLYGRREEDKKEGIVGVARRMLAQADKQEKPSILIVDQLEEALTSPIKGYPEEFSDYFKLLKKIINQHPRIKAVLGFRSEYLPQVREQLKGVKYDDDLFLKPLNEAGIREAIVGVSQDSRLEEYPFGSFSFENGLPDVIVEKILSDKDSNQAPLLQAQLLGLWKAAREEKPLGAVQLSREHYKALGYDSLAGMLGRQLESMRQYFKEEVQGGLALDILYFFTTRRDTAATHSDEETFHEYPREKVEPIIHTLERYYLLFRFNDFKGRPHSRLAHDALAPIIRDQFERSDAWGQRARRILESKKLFIEAGNASFKDEEDIRTLEMGRPYMRTWTPKEVDAFNKGKEAVYWQIEQERNIRKRNFEYANERIQESILRLNYESAFEEAKKAAELKYELEQLALAFQEMAFFWSAAGQKGKAVNALSAVRDMRIYEGLDKVMEQIVATPSLPNFKQALIKIDEKRYQELQIQYFPDMVFVKGGSFLMGNDEIIFAKPIHNVTLNNFYIARTPTTFWQYYIFSLATGKDIWEIAPLWGIYGDNPIIKVNCNDANEYCNWICQHYYFNNLSRTENQNPGLVGSELNFRLPSEAEWEYAARGGKKSKGYKYSGSNDLGKVGWFKDNSKSKGVLKTHPVKSKAPNELGLYDMSGNVREWCQDWWDDDKSDRDMRVVRGGSWDDKPPVCDVSYRYRYPPHKRNNIIGFRIVGSA